MFAWNIIISLHLLLLLNERGGYKQHVFRCFSCIWKLRVEKGFGSLEPHLVATISHLKKICQTEKFKLKKHEKRIVTTIKMIAACTTELLVEKTQSLFFTERFFFFQEERDVFLALFNMDVKGF